MITLPSFTLRRGFLIFLFATPLVLALLALRWPHVLWSLIILLPVGILGVIDMVQTKQTVRRLYPFFGRFRYMLEAIRPEIQQYFVESETSGTPVPREFRSLIYQRAKGARDTRPFGTIFDVNRAGYEWMNHSLVPKTPVDMHPRVKFGSKDCRKPYLASPLNISAWRYRLADRHGLFRVS